MTRTSPSLAARLIAWHAEHGRHDLPWQTDATPNRVWVSEIMLQQTQVATVIDYFDRFMARFPDVSALANAPLDEVLHLWSGLGYYARARNLHRAARKIKEEFRGVFPDTIEDLTALPGIGRSTAGAIMSLAYGARAAILDGNVKRVLARYHAVDGWPGKSAVAKMLWALAESELPATDCRIYTQALMDLGAGICGSKRPQCPACPLRVDCAGHRSGHPEDYPSARPKRVLPERTTKFLVIQNESGEVLLERRPPQGIWGGLWCFPELACGDIEAEKLTALSVERYEPGAPLPGFTHTFTHFKLAIEPVVISARGFRSEVRANDQFSWYDINAATAIGLPRPVQKLLQALDRQNRDRQIELLQ